MISSTKDYIAAGIAAHVDGLVLLGRRSKNCYSFADHWSMPCGMIDPGEHPEQAARREFSKKQEFELTEKYRFSTTLS